MRQQIKKRDGDTDHSLVFLFYMSEKFLCFSSYYPETVMMVSLSYHKPIKVFLYDQSNLPGGGAYVNTNELQKNKKGVDLK